MRARLLLLLLLLTAARPLWAQPRPEYVQFQPVTVKGALYRPDSKESEIAILMIHRTNNFLGHGAAWELARRGFVVLAMNSRFDNNEAAVINRRYSRRRSRCHPLDLDRLTPTQKPFVTVTVLQPSSAPAE